MAGRRRRNVTAEEAAELLFEAFSDVEDYLAGLFTLDEVVLLADADADEDEDGNTRLLKKSSSPGVPNVIKKRKIIRRRKKG